MKRLHLIFAFMSVFASVYCETSYDELFSAANKLYRENKFKEAMKRYTQIPHKSSIINYNLGNCAYQLGKLGKALVYYRRAEKEWGFLNRGELLDNMLLVKKRLKQDESVYGMKEWLTSLLRASSLGMLQFIFLSIWILLFLVLKPLSRRRQKLLIVPLFFLVAIFGTLLAIKYSFEAQRYAIAIRADSKLLSGPDKRFQVLSVISEGQEMTITKVSNGYAKIKNGSHIGWIEKACIEEI